jgi:hypothetical protein
VRWAGSLRSSQQQLVVKYGDYFFPIVMAHLKS